MSRLEDMHRIVKNRQSEKVEGFLIDIQTANLFVRAHEKASEKVKYIIENAPLERVINRLWRLVSK